MSELLAPLQPIAETDEGGIYIARTANLNQIDSNHEVYVAHRRREQLWHRIRQVATITPLLASVAIMESGRVNSTDWKVIVSGAGVAVAGVSALYSSCYKDENAMHASDVAVATYPLYDALGMARSEWVQEGLAERQQWVIR